MKPRRPGGTPFLAAATVKRQAPMVRVDRRAVPCPECGVVEKAMCTNALGLDIENVHRARLRMATRAHNTARRAAT